MTEQHVAEAPPLNFTVAAAEKVGQLIAQEGNSALKLRVYVQGGGCSGFQYGFTFDEEKPNDYVLQVKDIRVVVDKQSSLKLHGSTVDWIEDFRGAGFSVENPNATASCGCGKSFS
jgi:iron-sulfur cluster insertion protein